MTYLRPGTRVLRVADGAVGVVRKSSASYIFGNAGPGRGYSIRWDGGDASVEPEAAVRRLTARAAERRQLEAAPPVVVGRRPSPGDYVRAARAERAAKAAAAEQHVETRGGRREGAGRPAGNPAARRSKLVAVRVTQDELDALVVAAYNDGADDLSSWLRERALDAAAKVKP